MDNIINLSCGNPGAMEVLAKVMQTNPDAFASCLNALQRNHIKGADIWIIYKLCKKDVQQFVEYPFDTYKLDYNSY